MEDYLNGIDEDLWKRITGEVSSPSALQNIGTATSSPDVNQQTDRKKRNEKKCLCELRGSLPPVVYYVEMLEEVREKTKGRSLVAKGSCDEKGTYQIWSYGLTMKRCVTRRTVPCLLSSKKQERVKIE